MQGVQTNPQDSGNPNIASASLYEQPFSNATAKRRNSLFPTSHAKPGSRQPRQPFTHANSGRRQSRRHATHANFGRRLSRRRNHLIFILQRWQLQRPERLLRRDYRPLGEHSVRANAPEPTGEPRILSYTVNCRVLRTKVLPNHPSPSFPPACHKISPPASRKSQSPGPVHRDRERHRQVPLWELAAPFNPWKGSSPISCQATLIQKNQIPQEIQ